MNQFPEAKVIFEEEFDHIYHFDEGDYRMCVKRAEITLTEEQTERLWNLILS